MLKEWFELHDLYETEPRLQQRLQIVRAYIFDCLEACPPGKIRGENLAVPKEQELFVFSGVPDQWKGEK